MSTPDRVIASETEEVYVEVVNYGTAEAENVNLRVYDDATPSGGSRRLIGQTTLVAIAPDSLATHEFSYTPQPHYEQRQIIAVVDEANQIKESDEDNNTLQFRVTVDYRELTVSSMSVPDRIVESERAEVYAEIVNYGTAESENVNVRVYDDAVRAGGERRLIAQKTFPGILPEQTASLSTNFTARAPYGVHRIVVMVDEDNQIRESEEGNNSMEVIVSVEPPPRCDIEVSSLNIEQERLIEQEATQISVEITNQGEAVAQNVILRIYDDAVRLGGERRLIAREKFRHIQPGQAASFLTNLTARAPYGAHRIDAVADEFGQIEESEEGNNHLSIFLEVEKRARKVP